MLPKKKKAPSYKKLRDKLDQVFSLYIRNLYADTDGNVACFTCGVKKPVKEMQNGHFESRAHLNLRWSELNCRPQCYKCNIILNGNYKVYTRMMIKNFGIGILDRLDKEKLIQVKLTTVDLFKRIEYTKALVKNLERKK